MVPRQAVSLGKQQHRRSIIVGHRKLCRRLHFMHLAYWPFMVAASVQGPGPDLGARRKPGSCSCTSSPTCWVY